MRKKRVKNVCAQPVVQTKIGLPAVQTEIGLPQGMWPLLASSRPVSVPQNVPQTSHGPRHPPPPTKV
eukprot:158997-Chlamydomonas_euryale.AAC.2